MKNDCPTCRIIRTFLYLAAPMVLILGVYNNKSGADEIGFKLPFDLISVISYGALLAMIGMVAFRYYQEFYKPKRDQERFLNQQAQLKEEADVPRQGDDLEPR